MRNESSIQEMCSRVRALIEQAAAGNPPGPTQFEKLALEIFRSQFSSNPPYRAFCIARGKTPESTERLEDIPAVVTSAFKEMEFSCIPAQERIAVFHSSGTTQHRPSRHFHSRETLALYETGLSAGFQRFALNPRIPYAFAMLSPRAAQAPHSSLVHMFETVNREFGSAKGRFFADPGPDNGWLLRFAEIERALESAHEPLIICGTAFSFVHLCDYLGERCRTLHLPPNSRVFETGGYKGRSRVVSKDELYEMIQSRFGISENQIISEYGMSELSSQAYDSRKSADAPRTFQFPAWALAKVISPETGREVADGDTGLLRIYDLANVGFVLAVQTEDLVRRRGSRFEWIGRASQSEARGCSLMELSA